MATIYYNIGAVYDELGEYTKSISSLLNAQQIFIKIYGKQHHIVKSIDNIISELESKLNK